MPLSKKWTWPNHNKRKTDKRWKTKVTRQQPTNSSQVEIINKKWIMKVTKWQPRFVEVIAGRGEKKEKKKKQNNKK